MPRKPMDPGANRQDPFQLGGAPVGRGRLRSVLPTITTRSAARSALVSAVCAVVLLSYAWLATPGFGPQRYLSELGVGTAPHRWIYSGGVAAAALSILFVGRIVPGHLVTLLLMGCGL